MGLYKRSERPARKTVVCCGNEERGSAQLPRSRMDQNEGTSRHEFTILLGR